ncbi:hypothetical protein DFH06DRAFT_1363718 [Mycena polygramma]|nr:hypothetical protein DFH06DRAFT_1363718 [Mycena polygramma]
METNRLASCWDVWRKGMGRSHGPLGATFLGGPELSLSVYIMPRATCSRRNGQRCTCYRRLNAPDLWALQIDEQLTTGGHSRQAFIVTQTGQNEQASQHRNIAPANDFEPGKVARMETALTCTTLRFGRTQRETAQTSSVSLKHKYSKSSNRCRACSTLRNQAKVGWCKTSLEAASYIRVRQLRTLGVKKSFSGPCLRAAPIQRGGGVGGKIDGVAGSQREGPSGHREPREGVPC